MIEEIGGGEMKIRIKRFDKAGQLPVISEKGAACFDFFSREAVTIPPHAIRAVPQNVAIAVPEGHVLLMFSRSSTPMRKGLMLANGVGVIDPFYSGDNDENLAFMHNITDQPVTVEAGDRIVQGMFVRPLDFTWQEVEQMGEAGHGGYRHETALH